MKYPDAEPLLGFIGAAKQKVNQLVVDVNAAHMCLYVNAEVH